MSIKKHSGKLYNVLQTKRNEACMSYSLKLKLHQDIFYLWWWHQEGTKRKVKSDPDKVLLWIYWGVGMLFGKWWGHQCTQIASPAMLLAHPCLSRVVKNQVINVLSLWIHQRVCGVEELQRRKHAAKRKTMWDFCFQENYNPCRYFTVKVMNKGTQCCDWTYRLFFLAANSSEVWWWLLRERKWRDVVFNQQDSMENNDPSWRFSVPLYTTSTIFSDDAVLNQIPPTTVQWWRQTYSWDYPPTILLQGCYREALIAPTVKLVPPWPDSFISLSPSLLLPSYLGLVEPHEYRNLIFELLQEKNINI